MVRDRHDPDFTLPAVEREGTVSLADYRGKSPLLLALFRGVYCPFCRRAITQMSTMRQKLQAMGVDTLGIVTTRPEHARLCFRHFPTRLPLVADPVALDEVSLFGPGALGGGCAIPASRKSEIARRARVCVIARGYRTQVFAATYWRKAELQVVARRGQAQDRVFSDLQGCASTNGAVAGARPLEIAGAVNWVNARFGRDGQARDHELAALVAHCLVQQGYAAEPIARARE